MRCVRGISTCKPASLVSVAAKAALFRAAFFMRARIYDKAGFQLVEEEAHHSVGKDLVGQVLGRGR